MDRTPRFFNHSTACHSATIVLLPLNFPLAIARHLHLFQITALFQRFPTPEAADFRQDVLSTRAPNTVMSEMKAFLSAGRQANKLY